MLLFCFSKVWDNPRHEHLIFYVKFPTSSRLSFLFSISVRAHSTAVFLSSFFIYLSAPFSRSCRIGLPLLISPALLIAKCSAVFPSLSYRLTASYGYHANRYIIAISELTKHAQWSGVKSSILLEYKFIPIFLK